MHYEHVFIALRLSLITGFLLHHYKAVVLSFLFSRAGQAARKGQRARQTMVEKYAPARLADTVESHLQRIEELLHRRNKEL